MTPPVVVAIVNRSTVPEVENALPSIVRALGRQLSDHVQPLWGRVLPSLLFLAKDSIGAIPKGASPLVLLDDADQADALGYHDETPEGLPYGRVFVQTILGYGGSLTKGDEAVSVTLSHELLELVGDPSVNLWADGPDGYAYALELCDAVEGDSYAIDGISVSNFVTPAFFDPLAEPGSRLDYLGKLGLPFTMTAGGYQIRRHNTTGAISNVFGHAFPDWKRAVKGRRGARSNRRQRLPT